MTDNATQPPVISRGAFRHLASAVIATVAIAVYAWMRTSQGVDDASGVLWFAFFVVAIIERWL